MMSKLDGELGIFCMMVKCILNVGCDGRVPKQCFGNLKTKYRVWTDSCGRLTLRNGSFLSTTELGYVTVCSYVDFHVLF